MFTPKPKKMLPTLAATLALTALASASHAQINYTGGTYNESFDGQTQGTTALTLNNSPVSAVPGVNGFFAKSGSTTGTFTYAADNGASSTGRLFNYGTTGATDRALGSLGSGTPQYITFGAFITNNTGSTITDFTLAYTGEQWRNGGNTSAQTDAFLYKVFDAGVAADLGADTYTGSGPVNPATGTGTVSDTSWTRVAALDFTSPVTGATASALDGNAAGNNTAISSTVSGLSIGAGQTLVLRFLDPNDAGNDHGLAIDNFAFSASVAPTPAPPGVISAFLGLTITGLGAVRRRRKMMVSVGAAANAVA